MQAKPSALNDYQMAQRLLAVNPHMHGHVNLGAIKAAKLLTLCRSRFNQHAPFEVERAHPPQLGRTSFTEGPDSARVSEPGTAKAAEGAEKSKRKGRFQIVEEDPTDPGKRGVGRSTSVASMDSHRSTQVCCTSCLHVPPPHCSVLQSWLRIMPSTCNWNQAFHLHQARHMPPNCCPVL